MKGQGSIPNYMLISFLCYEIELGFTVMSTNPYYGATGSTECKHLGAKIRVRVVESPEQESSGVARLPGGKTGMIGAHIACRSLYFPVLLV